MFGSECGSTMYVENLRYPPPKKIEGPSKPETKLVIGWRGANSEVGVCVCVCVCTAVLRRVHASSRHVTTEHST